MDKKKVLIIDSDQLLSRELKEIMEEEGLVVEQAYTAPQADTALEFFQPDLIITEIKLEGHDDGIKLINRVRRHPMLGKTPVFIYTDINEKTGAGFSLEEDGYWLKADDFAEKPISKEELLKRTMALLSSLD